MRFREVDIPARLIEAHRDGSLVIFVGAGASLPPPSSLPDFRALARAVAGDAGRTPEEWQLDKPDVFLGELDDDPYVNVHRLVASRIARPASRPSPVHQAVAALATSGVAVRVITTNYDLHLSTALASLGRSATEFDAPALPLGNDFEGLVYLHGSLRQQDGSNFVVTDRDFGKAYLRDAWATRFLERMFTNHTVLFVGYSHNDVVMTYLGLALGRDSPRYALTSTPDASNWRRLEITPVAYSVDEYDSHHAAGEALDRWAQWVSMGLLGHQRRVAELTIGPPPVDLEDAAYLEDAVADPDKVAFFTGSARGDAWLTWVVAQPVFKGLFDPSSPGTPCTAALGHWFAENFVMDEALTRRALSVVSQAGGRLSPETWSAIASRIATQQAPRPQWLNRWLVVLVETDPGIIRDALGIALVRSRWPEDREAALVLFDHLSELLPRYRSWFRQADGPALELRSRGRTDWLHRAWNEVFAPQIADSASDILPIVERHLRRSQHLMAMADKTTAGLLSYMRTTIENDGQPGPPHAPDVLVNAARDCLESLLDRADPLAERFIEAWAATDVPLLRRLAIHAWTYRGDVDATAKVNWLQEKGWLFTRYLRHEVYRLIEAALKDADPAVANSLVEDAAASPGDGRDELSFDTLDLMVRVAPELESAREAKARYVADHPEFTERPIIEAPPPLSVDELHELIEQDPRRALEQLLDRELPAGTDATLIVGRPGWRNNLGLLAEVVRINPNDGLRILEAGDGAGKALVERAVLWGWAAAQLDDDTANSVLIWLLHANITAVVDDVAALLAEGGTRDTAPTAWHRFPAARALSVALWEAIPPGGAVDEDRTEWLERAVNHPAGDLAQFWLSAISADRRAAGNAWTGLPTATKTQLETMLIAGGERSAIVEVIFAARIHLLHQLDRRWCEDWILPLLDWSDVRRARRTWDGFLLQGRWNDRLLATGLIGQYLNAAGHVETLSEHARERLPEHLAAVALLGDIHPLASNGWLVKFTTDAGSSLRTAWTNHITWALKDLPIEATERQWERWMRQYWDDRLASIPSQLTPDEASAIAAWPVYLGQFMSEGVDRATQTPAGIRHHSGLLNTIDQDLINQHPAPVASLLVHLLRHTDRPFYDCYSLPPIVQALRNNSQQAHTEAIVQEAIRLGCIDATAW